MVTTTTILQKLRGPKPAELPAEDLLGYAPLARQVAESICQCAPSDGIVFGIYGSWGSGKSTVLNYVRYFLNQDPLKSVAPSEFRFNPWWFSGQDNLLTIFFSELEKFLRHDKKFADVVEKLRSFYNALAEIELPISVDVLGGVLKLKTEGFKLPKIDRDKTFSQLRDDLAKALTDNKSKILITIDDLDRLQAAELCSILKIVGALANLPNVIYLLAFDKTVVADAIETELKMPGHTYIEKIIQAPFDLPLPDPVGLQGMLMNEFTKAVDGTKKDYAELDRGRDLYLCGLNGLVRTPRRVYRLINSFIATYRALINEVNAVDFLAIEAIRLFCPTVYEQIRLHPNMFAMHADGSTETLKSFHEDQKSNMEKDNFSKQEIAHIYELLTFLFPQLGSLQGKVSYSEEARMAWAHKRMICSEMYVRRYLAFSLAAGDVSTMEAESVMNATSDSAAISLVWSTIGSGEKRASRSANLINRLREEIRHKSISSQQAEILFRAMSTFAEEVKGMTIDDTNVLDLQRSVILLLADLLGSIDESSRYVCLERVLVGAERPVSGISLDLLCHLSGEHGFFSQAERKKTEGQTIDLETLRKAFKAATPAAVAMVRNAERESTGNLFSAIRFLNEQDPVLNEQDPGELQTVLDTILESDLVMAKIVSAFLEKQYIASGKSGRWESVLAYDLLSKVIEPKGNIKRIRKLSNDKQLNEDQRFALEKYVQAYDLRLEKKNTAQTASKK